MNEDDMFAAQEGEDDGEVVALPEEVLCFRLMSLPPSVLWHIARRMGRRSRVVSRALLDAYGPLDCGLVLTGATGYSELRRMLAAGGQRLQHTTSLQLNPGPWPEKCPEADLLATVAMKLPNLGSLALSLRAGDLPLLGPLHCTLTALAIEVPPDPWDPGTGASLEGLAQLGSLRSLTLSGGIPSSGAMPAWQRVLGSLPQLARLSWFARDVGAWTPQWLAGLRPGTPRLTSLALGCRAAPPELHAWDGSDTSALLQALSGVQSLSLEARAVCGGSAAAADAMVAALSRCSWIEAVHLSLTLESRAPPPDLRQLSRLQLASLHVDILYPDSLSWLEALMHAPGALGRLTKLDLCVSGDLPERIGLRLPSSLVELQLQGGRWDPHSLLPALHTLPSLRVLGLRFDASACSAWAPAAAGQLSTLTQLSALSVSSFVPGGFVAGLAGLTALRELRLAHVCGDGVTGWDLLQLVPLRDLTRLVLGGTIVMAPAASTLALLGCLPALQQLELALELPGEEEARLLGEGLLPRVLPRLTRLKVERMQLPGGVRGALVAAAEAHGCRCDVGG